MSEDTGIFSHGVGRVKISGETVLDIFIINLNVTHNV